MFREIRHCFSNLYRQFAVGASTRICGAFSSGSRFCNKVKRMLQFFRSPSGPYPERRAIQQMWNTLCLNWRWFFVTQSLRASRIGAFRPRSAKVVSIQPCSTCASKLMAASLHNSSEIDQQFSLKSVNRLKVGVLTTTTPSPVKVMAIKKDYGLMLRQLLLVRFCQVILVLAQERNSNNAYRCSTKL